MHRNRKEGTQILNKMSSNARIKLICDDIKKINNFIEEIKNVTEKFGASIGGPIPLPTQKLRITTRKSPCGDGKSSFERYQMRIHKRVLNFDASNERLLRQIMKIQIPQGLNIKLKLQ